MSRSHHASDCRSGTIRATVSYTGSVFCSVSMSTNRRVHTPLHLICIQCRTNSLFCISERPLGRGDTSIFSLTRCISTGILSYTASLYNTSTPHRNLYVGITELIVTQQSPHGVYCFLFFVVLCPGSAGYSPGEIFFLPVISYNLHCIIFSCIYYKIFSGVYAIL